MLAQDRHSLTPRIGVVGGYFVARVAVGALVALPLAASVGSLTAGFPGSDAVLWEPGGVMLLEIARLLEPQADGILWGSAAFVLVGIFALLLPFGALVAACGPASPVGARRALPARQLWARAGESWGTLGLLQGLTLLGQALLLGLFDLVGRLLARSLELGYAGQRWTELALLAVGFGVAWMLGVAQDVARVGAIQHRRGLVGAVALALRVLGAGRRTVLVAAGWRGVLTASMLGAAAWAGLVVDCQRPGRALLVASAHLLAVLGAVLVRVSWLGWLTDRITLTYGLPADLAPLPSEPPGPADGA
jgi:hypothetical protein